MGEFSIWHWMVVLLVVLLLFGGGKVSNLMGDLAKGIKAFKKNMADEEPAKTDAAARPTESIAPPTVDTMPPAAPSETVPAREAAPAPRETTAAH